jgi:prophage maintenance system killer protein
VYPLKQKNDKKRSYFPLKNEKIIEIYKSKDGKIYVEVDLKKDTIWLNLNQMSILFERDKSVISRHLKNIYQSNELDEKSTVAFFATVQTEGKRRIERNIQYYNLDAIISLGYRVNSKIGTQFRIWATKILKQNIVKGYTINEKRLHQQLQKLSELKNTITIIEQTSKAKQLDLNEAQGLLKVITDYSYGLKILDNYDHECLKTEVSNIKEKYRLNIDDAYNYINKLKEQFNDSELVGMEKDKSFHSAINTIYQTWKGKELYPSIEEKAAHLLYFIIKNHSFIDGNKRIGAFIFIQYLNKNGLLYNESGNKRIADNALVALTLMIASSDAKEKQTIIKVIINLISMQNK